MRWVENTANFSFKVTCVICWAVASVVAFAGEGGRSEYPLGFTDLYVGYLPEPGEYFTNYLLYWDANLKLATQGATTRYNLSAAVDALSLLHVSHLRLLGSYWAWSIRVPFAYADIAVQNPMNETTLSEHTFGLGDIAIDPVIIGWNGEKGHLDLSTVVYIPTGEYNKNDVVTVGLNRWAIEEDVGYTWLDTQAGYELSALLGYTAPFANPATHYTSGQELHLDFAAAWHPPSGWTLGLVGYDFVQTTADSGSGATLGSFQGRAFALGPLISWSSQGAHPVWVTLKDYFDISTENRFSGQTVWLNLIWAL